jgi:hypothetical protein
MSKNMNKNKLFISLLGCFALTTNLHAAYIDPGTGSYVAQLAIAAIAGGLYFLKVSWGRVKEFFARLFSRSQDK